MRIAILAYSPLGSDARILRQIEFLSSRHEVLVVAEEPPPSQLWGAQFRALPAAGWLARKYKAVRRRAGVLVGMRFRDFLGRWTAAYRRTMRALRGFRPDLILCNELHPMSVSRDYHRSTGCPVLLDLHEFYCGDSTTGPGVEKYDRPNTGWALRDAARWAAGATAVNEMIAQRYRDDYRLDCGVIYNAPRLPRPPVFRPVNPACIELVHVGVIHAERRPEVMAEGVMLAGDPWRLHFYLAGDQQRIAAFREHWHTRSEGRIMVHETLPVAEIEAVIARCDVGVSIIAPLSWNWLMSSPNKFFSYLGAGLAMILGPKPWKQMMNERWHLAEMTGGFEAADFAATLRKLTPERINELKRNAIAAAAHLNGDIEGAKLLALCERIAARRPAFAEALSHPA